jgi:hypothetical protein
MTGGTFMIEINRVSENDDLVMIVEEISAAKWQ